MFYTTYIGATYVNFISSFQVRFVVKIVPLYLDCVCATFKMVSGVCGAGIESTCMLSENFTRWWHAVVTIHRIRKSIN